MNNVLKDLMNRMLQKQDYALVCFNDNVNTLAENDKHIAKSLDKLRVSTERKIVDPAIVHGKEIVKVNSSLDVIKKQVLNVSNSIDLLKKKPSSNSYKSTTLFSEPSS